MGTAASHLIGGFFAVGTAVFTAAVTSDKECPGREFDFYRQKAKEQAALAVAKLYAVAALAGFAGWIFCTLAFKSDVPTSISALRGLVFGFIGLSMVRVPFSGFPVDGSAEVGSVLHRASKRVLVTLAMRVSDRIDQYVRTATPEELGSAVLRLWLVHRGSDESLAARTRQRERESLQAIIDNAKISTHSMEELRARYKKYVQEYEAPEQFQFRAHSIAP